MVAAGQNVLATVRGYMAAMSIAILCLHASPIGVVDNAAAQGLAASSSLAENAAAHRAMLDRYCVVCHNDTLLTAGLSLARLDLADVGAAAATWERVVRKLDSGTMPPAGRPRPDKGARDAFVSWLEDTLDAEFADDPNPGRPAVHRLNRAEYANVIRDLLALEIDGRSLLPADDSGYGFDNIADVLRLSPGLLERYLTAATRISRQAIGDATIRPGVRTYQLPYLTLVQSGRMSEDLPFGSRGWHVGAPSLPPRRRLRPADPAGTEPVGLG